MEENEALEIKNLVKASDGFSLFFADYLSEYHKVQQFFEVDFHPLRNFPAYARQISERFPHREEIAEILNAQNSPLQPFRRALDNIELLRSPNTVAIVTGQQVGIFTGPLYTIYKTITALKLVEQLKAAYPEYNFVPIFWLEGEDHDFDEMNKITVLNAEAAPSIIEYLIDGKPVERNVGAVGELVLGTGLRLFFEQIAAALPKTEFKDVVVRAFGECYSEGKNFSTAFAELMNRLFPDEGLVFINPNDRRLKMLMRPIFRSEIADYPSVSQLIIERSAELEDRYHAQIKPKAVNLFLFHKGGRYLIEPREHDFSLKGTRQFFSKEDLLKMVEETPELFSPNVALRPICQDTLLPTLAYIGGPAEISYFAQLSKVYKRFGLSMPIIYPRASATILEERLMKTMEKYQLDLPDLFDNPDSVNRKVVELVSEVKVDDMFTNALERVRELINEMKFGLNYIDPTLLGALETTRGKIEGHLQVLRDKAMEAQQRRHETALRQVGRVINTVFPSRNFQERELNIIHYMNKFGMDFPRFLKNTLEINLFKHQIIKI